MICRKHKMRLLGAAVAFLILSFVSGCANNVPATASTETAQADKQQTHDKNAAAANSTAVNNTQNKATMKFNIYFATKDGANLQAEEQVVPATAKPAHTAIELLLAGPKNHDLVAVMPSGVKLRSLNIKDHIAYVDFNDAILKNDNRGSTAEMLLVSSVVNTLTEFHDINKVQILVNGQIVDTLYGHMDLSEPLSKAEKIVKPK